MDTYVLIGIAGLASLLWAFYLAEAGKISIGLWQYTLLNAAGSFLLIIYSLHIGAWIFTILNIVWFLVAMVKLIHPHFPLKTHRQKSSRRRD